VPSDFPTNRFAHERVLQFAGGVFVLVGLHYAVEAALGRVHAIPGSSPLAPVYGVAAAGLFLGVGAALLRRGDLADRRTEWASAALSLVVLAVVVVARLA
jgi:hypothetical protein